MTDVPKPRRRYDLTVTVGADSWEWVVRELERLTAHISEHGPACDSVSGGPDVGSTVHIVETPEQTHDSYFRELETYLDAVRAEGM